MFLMDHKVTTRLPKKMLYIVPVIPITNNRDIEFQAHVIARGYECDLMDDADFDNVSDLDGYGILAWSEGANNHLTVTGIENIKQGILYVDDEPASTTDIVTSNPTTTSSETQIKITALHPVTKGFAVNDLPVVYNTAVVMLNWGTKITTFGTKLASAGVLSSDGCLYAVERNEEMFSSNDNHGRRVATWICSSGGQRLDVAGEAGVDILENAMDWLTYRT